MHQPLYNHVKTTAKIMNTKYMKTTDAKNSAQLITLVNEEGKSLHHEVVKTLSFVGHSAGFFPIFTSEFVNR